MRNSIIAFVAVLAVLGLLTACSTTAKAKRRHIKLPPVPGKKVQKTMSPKVAAQQIKYAAPPPLNLPPPPNSNRWLTLTFSTNGPGMTFKVYFRSNLNPGTPWNLFATLSSVNPSYTLPLDQTSPPMFFTTTATQFVKSVTLAWDASASPAVAGYKLYYGPTSRGYTNAVSVGLATSCTVSNIKEASTYYFAATAYDTNGVESDYSTETNFFVPIHGAPPVRTFIAAGPGLPSLLTSSAASPFPTNMTMFGRVLNTGGDAPITMFFYGTKNPAFKTNAWENVIVTGMANGTNLVEGDLNTLQPGTTYYCAFAARNAVGVAQGNILSVTTPILPPKANIAKIKRVKEEPVFSPLPETPQPPARIFIDPR